jgi:ATP-grasp domain, R2K clade family 3
VGQRHLRGDHRAPRHTRRPDAGGFSPGPAAALIDALRLPFVTADFARREDGVWRLIELGDGQVSDRPATTPPHALITALQTSSP